MKIAGLIKNDIVNGIGVCVSLFVQGCPHRCIGCHNPETWDFEGGTTIVDIKGTIIKAICANGIQRNFSILGGEPLCPENLKDVKDVIAAVKTAYPNIKIFLWTGYELNELLERISEENLAYILDNIDYLIDGRFVKEKQDMCLWLRGSRNQNVYKLTEEKNFVIINKEEIEKECNNGGI